MKVSFDQLLNDTSESLFSPYPNTIPGLSSWNSRLSAASSGWALAGGTGLDLDDG